MDAMDVVDLYRWLEKSGVHIWIDGGWAVDAALGRQTREHGDLDIAVEAKSVAALRRSLAQRGFHDLQNGDESEWNFVLADEAGRRIDVHVVMLDGRDGVVGPPQRGIAYPAGSLTGEGVIAGTQIRCVRSDFLLQFKMSYAPRPSDRSDVAELCALLGRPVPDAYK